jgi:hypothetical protein
MKAAGMALPFEHPKLAVVVTNREGDLADRLMAALQASQQVIGGRATGVIEHSPKAEAGETANEVDHSKPFARLRRF